MTASNQTQQTPDDGGPAFPWGEYGTHLGGMTLRDYFAATALPQAWIAEVAEMSHFNTDVSSRDVSELLVAKRAYRIADAMLKARTTP